MPVRSHPEIQFGKIDVKAKLILTERVQMYNG